MYQNKKAYEVTFSGGLLTIVEANEVQETATRVKFLGYVPGHNEGSYNSEVVRSFLNTAVESYRLIPVPEQNDRAEGQHTFRFTFKDNTTKEVRGDYVSHAEGREGKPGRYIVATKQRHTDKGRTEYVTADDRVQDIERVVPEVAGVSVSEQDTYTKA